jgi:hypothetical protein
MVHASAEVDPKSRENLPNSHSVQKGMAWYGLYVLGGQRWHRMLLNSGDEKVPGKQALQDVLAKVSE